MALQAISALSEAFEKVKLDDSPFSATWLVETLRERDSTFRDIVQKNNIRNVSAVNISGGKGFVSKVYRCSVEFDSNQPDYHVILKVPDTEAMNSAFDDASQSKAFENCQQVATFHNHECEFYEKFAAEINFPMPKIFSTRRWTRSDEVGYLLMEDMSGNGESACMYAGLSKAQLLTIAKHIAHFQYYFLTLPDHSWQEQFAMEKLIDYSQIINLMMPMYDKLVQMKPELFENKIEPLYEACKNKKFHEYTMVSHSKDTGVPYVLSHGDLWSNNIMWKLDEHGNITNDVAAIIDYQIVHTGSITNDLARVLVCCTDADVRREHETAVLRCYYDTLAALYQKDDREVPFSFDQAVETYKISMVCQTTKVMWLVPLFCCGEKAPGTEMLLWKARTEKFLLRTSLALDDALKVFEMIPKKNIED